MRSGNFVEETTTSIAGTGGNGAITLTAIANTPRFSTVLGTQATTIRYVIEDTVGKRFETGIGSVAANVLTRTRPQITWDGTTYDDSTPAPVAFGSAPTLGNIRVRQAATAESQGGNVPGANRTVGSAAWRDYPITAGVGWDFNGGDGPLTVNRETYTCYELTMAGLLDGLQIDVTTAAAGNIKLALYACGTNGLPGAKIVDFNLISTSTTGIKTDTATGTWSPAGPVWLAPGWYYIGFISDVACGIRGMSSSTSSGNKTRTPLGRTGSYGWMMSCFVGGNYATGLPANPAPTTSIEFNSPLSLPWIGLRVTP